MSINPASIRSWSRLGQRGTVFAVALLELAQTQDNLKLLTADLALLSGMDRFTKTYPGKYLNVGIAEQNMIGIAAGLAMTGYNVFATTYASFIAVRALEHVRQHLAHMRYPIKLIGTSGGIASAKSGVSHWATEDVAFMRALPNIVILSPADSLEAYKLTHLAAMLDSPVYLRLSGGLNCPVVYEEDYDLEIGKAVHLKRGGDIALLTTGMMVSECLRSAEILESKGISCSVVNFHTIKPLDIAALDAIFNTHKLIATVEEHSVIGGLGGAVAEYKATLSAAPRQVFFGFRDFLASAGSPAHVWGQAGLMGEQIAAKLQEELESAGHR